MLGLGGRHQPASCNRHVRLQNRLIHLFEGGILEKMTNAEYELMINHSKNRTTHDSVMVNDGQKTAQKNTFDLIALGAVCVVGI